MAVYVLTIGCLLTILNCICLAVLNRSLVNNVVNGFVNGLLNLLYRKRKVKEMLEQIVLEVQNRE